MEIAIFGDIGGHYDPYANALEKLGVNLKKNLLPKGLAVIQVGDLIDRGPDSEKVIEFVNKLMVNNRKTYIQLLGNHEGRLLGGPKFTEFNQKEYPLQTKTVHTIQSWYLRKMANMAVGISGTKAYGDLLVTHAGLTPFLYKCLNTQKLSSVVLTLNMLKPNQAFSPGIMLGGNYNNAGVAWADAVKEVYLPWGCQNSVPFGQIHGHTRAYNYNKNQWKDLGPELLPHAHVDKTSKHTVVWIKKKPFIGVDPGFGKYDPGSPIIPFIVEGNLVSSQDDT